MADDHGHRLPAVEDWPRGFDEASWWPFVAAMGAAGVYVGLALAILGAYGLFTPLVGAVVFVGSVFLFLAGLYGWTYHAFVKAFWDLEAHGDVKHQWAMVLFLGTEISTFGALFVYYFQIRIASWPRVEDVHLIPLQAGTLSIGAVELPIINYLVLANTLILIASSVTIHWAHHRLLEGNRRHFVAGLAATLLLGLVFLAGQVTEYYEFVAHHGFTITSGLYASAFFGLTGLHGLHVALGVALIATVLARALYGQYSADRHTSVSTVSMYWHFVDAVWIMLVVALYVGAVVAG